MASLWGKESYNAAKFTKIAPFANLAEYIPTLNFCPIFEDENVKHVLTLWPPLTS